jgi:FAD-dependent urate hydroxylase
VDGLSVAIIGGGIGGLNAAVALQQAGFDVRVYERAPAIEPIGAGLCLWPNGTKVLDALRLGSHLPALSAPLDRVQYRDPTGRVLSESSLEPLFDAVGERAYPVTRGDLQSLLRAQLSPEKVVLSMECVAVDGHGKGAVAVFADGSRVGADVIVGADGIRSVVRRHMLGRDVPLRYHYTCWVGIVPASEELNPPATFTFHVGQSQRCGMLPVGGDRLYFFLDAPLPPDVELDGAETKELLTTVFEGWSDPVERLIARVDPAATARLAVHDFDPLPAFVSGKVALLGDAAHAMTPTLGQGALQAMEDGIVLARQLLTTNKSVDDALRRYEAERRPRTADVVLAARARTGALISTADPDASEAWYSELASSGNDLFVERLAQLVQAGPLP